MINRKVIILCLFSVLFFSCEEEETDYGLGEYYKELTTALSGNEFLLDNGTILYTKETQNYESGSRVLLRYSYVDGGGVEKRNIHIHSSGRINSTELTVFDAEAIHSADNEPIRLESVWISGGYLNMQFYINYHSIPHSVALLGDEATIDENRIEVYFKHGRNDDPEGYPTKSILSFDLKNSLGTPVGDRTLSVNINTSNYGDKAYELVY